MKVFCFVRHQQNPANHKVPRRAGLDALNQATLYNEESGFLKAKARTTAYIAKLIRWEFGKFAEDVEKSRNELGKIFRDALKTGSEDF
jgi:hypothetical protein